MPIQESSVISPVVIPRVDHNISRSRISESALKVLYRLKDAGYESYLVGGGVRDLLLEREPKDFDVATIARPEEVQALFRNSRVIGRRFRLAHVQFGREIVEVATFRANRAVDASAAAGPVDPNGRLLRDNTYGTLEEDAVRRDFSVNALYYDIRDFSVRDYVGGLADLRAGVLRLIGDPETRYREDPVRMLRAARFAAKLGFHLHPDTEAPIRRLAPLLAEIPPPRLFEEILKLFLYGFGAQSFAELRRHGLLAYLFPRTNQALDGPEHEHVYSFISKALASTDARVAAGKPVTPAFLFAAMLWEPAQSDAQRLEAQGLRAPDALRRAADALMSEEVSRVALPRRFSAPAVEMYQMQARFLQRQGKRPVRLLTHPRFRFAYDFLMLRAAAGEADPELATWWTEAQTAGVPGEAPAADAAAVDVAPTHRRRRRHRHSVSA
ncbi:MAG: polynucleotide adenylyltransferase PcnB [Gammaproteobacteria bacterium]